MDDMDPLLIFKALSNETRLNILEWLKDPEASLGPDCNSHCPELKGYACVGTIKDRSGLSQSVISGYLSTLQQAGLVKSERREKWTYYARNEETIAEFARYVGKELRPGIGLGTVPEWFRTSYELVPNRFVQIGLYSGMHDPLE